MPTSSIKQTYDTQGYVIVPNLISPSDFAQLQTVCDNVVNRTREGNWPFRRVVGKQFPPFDSENPDSWGVQHLMHPDLGESAVIFARWYTSDRLVNAVKELLECDEGDLQMELFNLLINPISHDFAYEEMRLKKRSVKLWMLGIVVALYEDPCLFVVPDSHLTPRSDEQRKLSSTMDAPKDPLEMPGAIRVTLQPGETVFYNSNILHCATYSHEKKRATLHATMGDSRKGDGRAQNILQHGLTWMQEERFSLTKEAIRCWTDC